MKTLKLFFLLLLAGIGFSSCKKYEEAPLIENPSYIRVFNNLAYTVSVFNSAQAPPFLTFLMDPEVDANGIPNGKGNISSDFLATRQLFSLSYASNAANSSTGNVVIDNIGNRIINPNPQNFEYPGNAHVLTAPAINGFDLSSWAQIPSGTHRFMFVLRPENKIPFKDLSGDIRKNILVDTTITFEPHEVYTLEVVSKDLDKNKYGLYVRKEAFIHQAFEEDKIYVGFVNLSGKPTLATQLGIDKPFGEDVEVFYSYNVYDDNANATVQLPNYKERYYSTLTKENKMGTNIPYLSLPLLNKSSFFKEGILRNYGQFRAGSGEIDGGTLPHFGFRFGGFKLVCGASPVAYNNYSINTPSTTGVRYASPNLNLIVSTGKEYNVYSTLNIMELAYDRVYVMQVQRGFNTVSKN